MAERAFVLCCHDCKRSYTKGEYSVGRSPRCYWCGSINVSAYLPSNKAAIDAALNR